MLVVCSSLPQAEQASLQAFRVVFQNPKHCWREAHQTPDLTPPKGLQGYQDLTKQSLMGGERDMVDKPDLDAHVFCLVLSDRGTVELTDDG